MNFFLFFCLFTVVFGRLETELPLEENIEYITKYAIPLANKIRKAEEGLEGAAKIVGGSAASLGQFPYQAGLIVYFPKAKIGACGGSLLTPNRVLTAAHCWRDPSSQGIRITVVLGSDTLFSGGTRIDSTDVVLANGYNPRYRWNDLAMIRLSSAVKLSDTIQPINLPSGTQSISNFDGEVAIVSGFGLTSDNGVISQDQVLNSIEVNVITNQMCKSAYLYKIYSSHICTTPMNSPKHYSSTNGNYGNSNNPGNSGNTGNSGNSMSKGGNICYGDDGGPLVIEKNGVKILIGVASMISDKGCSAGLPAVYTRVTAYLQFIKQNLDGPIKP